jgi:hypothetical protein
VLEFTKKIVQSGIFTYFNVAPFIVIGDVVAQMEMWWLSWGCGGSDGDVVAQLGMWWLRWGCGGSDGDVVAQLGMWWLSWGCGGSDGDVVAQMGMWWLRWRCGGSVGDVVAQMGMWWLSKLRLLGDTRRKDAAVPGSNPACLTVSWH